MNTDTMLRPPKNFFWLPTVGLLLGLAAGVRGQEAVQMSIAGADAAAARHKAASTLGYYNLKLGPTAWNFGAGLGLDYNSNVYYTENNPQGDFIFAPQINTRMRWPVSEQNSINLALGGGYSVYMKNTQLNNPFITQGSELSFDIYAGDFWINLHDRFSIWQYSYQDPTVAGGNYSQLQNALGPIVTWDLNKVVLKLGLDQVNYISLASSSGQPNGSSQVASLSAGYKLRPQMLVGLEVGGDLMTYSGNAATFNGNYSNSKQWNVGAFYDTPVTDYIHFTSHAGYTTYLPESSGATTGTANFNGVYAELAFTHRLNEYVSYSLSGGRTINLAFYGGSVDQYYARLTANWQVLRKVTLGTYLGYENGTYLSGAPQPYDRYGLGVTLGRAITAKLSGTLGYQFYLRQSDIVGQSYTLNLLHLGFNYAF